LPEKYKRFDSSYTNLLKAGLNNFYSQTGMKNFLSSLDLPYSQEELKELSEKLYEEFQIWQQRELPQDVAALFIDGLYCSP
jgi:transposase-like protein